MQHFYSNCTTVLSSIRTVSTRVLSSVRLFSRSLRTLALFMGLLLACGNAWGAAQTTTDNSYATGTITFDAIGSISAKATYWYNGIKIYSANSTNISTGGDKFTEKVTAPAYISATSGNKWGSYSMSGLLLNQHTLAVHIQKKSTLELVVNSNVLTTCSLTVCIDNNVNYGDAYDSNSYKTAGQMVIPTITRDENTGRYHYTLQVESECIVKFINTSSGSGAGKLFVYESVKVTPSGSTPSGDTYTVTFNANGHGSAPDPLTGITSGSTISAPTAPTADGYIFGGWYKEAACTTPWNFATDKVTENITLYAKWTAAPPATTYTVTFDANGHGSAPAALKGIASGSTIDEPTPAPTATDGYTFDGWYKEAACTTPWNFATDKVTDNITLYAKWIARKYAFGCYVFEDNTTVGANPSKTVTTSGTNYSAFDIDNISFGAMKITYDDGSSNMGYRGWKINTANAQISFYVENDSKVLLQSGSYGSGQQFTITYTDATTGKETSTTVAATTTLTVTAKADTKVTITTANSTKTATLKRLCISANTAPGVYTIRYAEGRPDAITGSSLTVQGVPTTTQQVEEGNSLTLPNAADIKIAAGSTTVYQFDGWSDGTHTYPASQTTIDNISSDLTLTALWEPVVFHIYYWDGQNEDNTQNTAINGLTPTTYTYASNETIPTDAVAITNAAGKTDVSFKNWKVRDWGDKTAFTLKDLDYKTTYHLYGDINLYAEWEETTGCTTILSAQATVVTSGSCSQMTSSIGTVSVSGSTSSNMKDAIKLNNSGYIELKPVSGRIFLAGDVLKVTFKGQPDKDKAMGFATKKDAATAEKISAGDVAKGEIVTKAYYIQEGDINADGTIRIYRSSDADRFYAIEVEQCQNVEMVTATVQPGGGVIDESDALAKGWSKQVQSNGHIWYTKTVAKGSHITLPTATFDGYKFNGYQKIEPKDDAYYEAGKQYPISVNTTFVAQWLPLTPTGNVRVTLDLNGGAFANSDDEALWTKEVGAEEYYRVIQEGSSVSLPDVVSPTDKFFEGYLDQNGDRYDANTPYNMYGNLDFVADWCSNQVTLTWECDNWETGTTSTFVLNSMNRAVKDYPQLTISGAPEGAEIHYTSSDPAVAIIRDNGEIIPYMAGETTITATFDGEGDYCSAEASYTLVVECNEPTPVIEGVGDLSGCNTTITLRVRQKATDGTISDYPAEGFSFQWYKDNKAIEGATQTTYTVQTVGDYFVVVHDFCYAQSENTAHIASNQSAIPEVERLAPFQFYRPGHTYPAEQATRHLFSYKSAGADASECVLTAVRKRNGVPSADIAEADLQTFISVSATPDSRGHYTVTAGLNSIPTSLDLQAGDTLTVTLTPFDDCGGQSTTYAEQIDIRIVGKPALAFIISGADQLTRDKAKFKLHGDFLTGINRADLYKQSGKNWADADINTPLPLYTAIQEQFEVVPVNGYADFNLYNYEPFDILLLTDFVRTGIGSKGSTTVTVIDSLAKLVDYRPMFSLKAHMAKAEFPTWATKGFIANPAKPAVNPQNDMTVLCLAHSIFDDLPEYTGSAPTTDDYQNKIIYNADGNIVVRITSEGGYDDKKALQGFEAVDATNFVNIAIIPTGKNNGTLITCCERQANINARLLILSVNADATSKLTPIGCQAIIKGLNYLLETDPVKVSDCSVTFNNKGGDHLWTTPANWSTGRVPLKEQNIQIAANCIVNTLEATAATIKIISGNTLTIQPKGALTANGQIWSIPSETDKHNTSEITNPNVIYILSDASGTGALVRIAGDKARLAATVQMYSPAYYTGYYEDGFPIRAWTYVGIPIQNAPIPQFLRGAYTYVWSEAKGWERRAEGTSVSEFEGVALSQPQPMCFTFTGDLALAIDRTITLTNGGAMNGMNLIGNSWTAPIQINKMETTNFGEGIEPTVYLYNTGRDPEKGPSIGDLTTKGQWMTIPVNSAKLSGFDGPKVIPAMQAFEVNFMDGATQQEATLTLDYDAMVYATIDDRTDYTKPLYAPRRNQEGNDGEQQSHKTAQNEPLMLRIRLTNDKQYSDLYLLQSEEFSEGFDAGWDGYWREGDKGAIGLYAMTGNGNLAVSAQPILEGITIAVASEPGKDYMLTFTYSGGDGEYPTLYLCDMLLHRSVMIDKSTFYSFRSFEGDMPNRFVLSATPGTNVDTSIADIVNDRGVWTLSNPEGEPIEVRIYDAAGRLCNVQPAGSGLLTLDIPTAQGVYMVHLKGQTTDKVVKIVR